jgi:hypothetical protein
VLAGGEEHRCARLGRVVEHAHRVAEPGGDVHVHGREPAAGLRVCVGHGDRDRLLQREHVVDAGLAREAVHERQLGSAGIAEHDRDAFLPEDLEKRLLAGDVCHGGPMIAHIGVGKSPAAPAGLRPYRQIQQMHTGLYR